MTEKTHMRAEQPTAGTATAPLGDSGMAMIIVIGWCMVLLGLALVVTQMTLKQIRPSVHTEWAFAALAAAEAGVDDYRARLYTSPTPYYLTADPTNPALTGWTPVPGGDTDAEFRYSVDRSQAGAGGDLRVYVVGRSPRGEGGLTRTLEASYSKRSTLDYVYLSDIETTAPEQPGAYSEVAATGGSFETAKKLAGALCTRYWWITGAVSPATSAANATAGIYPQGTQRNINFCGWPHIGATERLIGKVHTNDVWRLDEVDLSSTFLENSITSACPDSPSAAVGCPPNNPPTTQPHRFIAGSYGNDQFLGLDKWVAGTGTGKTNYQGNAATPAAGTYNTKRNPGYDTKLTLPTSPDLLKKQASLEGCVYTGPTRIRFTSDGMMHVTSPDTMHTAPWCDGTATGTALYSNGAPPHTTKVVDLSRFRDLVIYVQNVPRTTTDDVDNAYDLVNRQADGTDPGCKVKSATTNKYPFIIPSTAAAEASEQALFTSPVPTGLVYKGFPSERADPSSPWYGFSNCGNGDIYVQGQYKYSVTIAGASNIAITGDLTDWTSPLTPVPNYPTISTTLGKPNALQSSAVMGLVADKFVYLYRPYEADHTTWAKDWKTTNGDTPILNFALLAIDTCFGAQDPYYGSARQGYIYLYGSLAQKYRCIVGSNGGYYKNYQYDDRLLNHLPPYMLELSGDPWRNGRIGEVTPNEQRVGTTVRYQLALADEVTATVSQAMVSSGSASPVDYYATSHQLDVTATGPGLIVVSYVVAPSGSTVGDVRRLVIWAS